MLHFLFGFACGVGACLVALVLIILCAPQWIDGLARVLYGEDW